MGFGGLMVCLLRGVPSLHWRSFQLSKSKRTHLKMRVMLISYCTVKNAHIYNNNKLIGVRICKYIYLSVCPSIHPSVRPAIHSSSFISSYLSNILYVQLPDTNLHDYSFLNGKCSFWSVLILPCIIFFISCH